jgi:hypothetical protein
MHSISCMKYTLLLLLAIMTNLVIKTAMVRFYCIFVTMIERLICISMVMIFLFIRDNPPVRQEFNSTVTNISLTARNYIGYEPIFCKTPPAATACPNALSIRV